MNMKRFIPQISAIVIFIAVSCIFFSPLFQGKRVVQGDVTHYLGASKEITDYRAKTGKEALWTNSMFSGMPAYQISVQYPNNLVQYIQKFFFKVFPAPVVMIILCMVGFYFLLVTLKVDPWISIAGGIAFGLSSFFLIVLSAGHNTQGFAISYMAPVLMGVIITMRGRLWLGGALTALALAMELNANHLQITYYLMMTVLIIVIGESIRLFREGKMNYLVKAAGILGAAAFLAVLPNITNLLLTNEYGKASTRGQSELTVDNKDKKKTTGLDFDYATAWSYGISETMTLMIPDFAGGASEPIGSYDPDAVESVESSQTKYVAERVSAYFGEQSFTSGPVYVGAIICFLALLALFIVKDQIKWWLLGATLLSVCLAWGYHAESFSMFFFNHIPGYNKFRAVSMTLVIAELTLPILAFLALKEVFQNPGLLKEKMKLFYIAFAFTGGLSLLIWLSPGLFITPVSPENKAALIDRMTTRDGIKDKQTQDEIVDATMQARTEIVKSDALRSFLFILLAAGLLFFFARKPFGILPFAGAFTLLMLVDMWGVSARYLSEKKGSYEKDKKNEDSYPLSNADQMILQDQDPDYRVLNIASGDPWTDASCSYWHKSIGGYHGAKLKRTQELYEQELYGYFRQMGQCRSDSDLMALLPKMSGLNMLNMKYIIYNPEGGVLPNNYACGSAWFVNNVKMVASADEEVKEIKNFSPRSTAVIDKSFTETLGGFTPKFDSTAKIVLNSYSPNNLKYTSNAASDQLAVFSEIYYDKGWNAYIDGKPTPHVRADFVLRAMKVPAGKHEIEFKFEPSSYITGEKIALAGSLMLIIFIGGGIYLDQKKQKVTKQAA